MSFWIVSSSNEFRNECEMKVNGDKWCVRHVSECLHTQNFRSFQCNKHRDDDLYICIDKLVLTSTKIEFNARPSLALMDQGS